MTAKMASYPFNKNVSEQNRTTYSKIKFYQSKNGKENLELNKQQKIIKTL